MQRVTFVDCGGEGEEEVDLCENVHFSSGIFRHTHATRFSRSLSNDCHTSYRCAIV